MLPRRTHHTPIKKNALPKRGGIVVPQQLNAISRLGAGDTPRCQVADLPQPFVCLHCFVLSAKQQQRQWAVWRTAQPLLWLKAHYLARWLLVRSYIQVFVVHFHQCCYRTEFD